MDGPRKRVVINAISTIGSVYQAVEHLVNSIRSFSRLLVETRFFKCFVIINGSGRLDSLGLRFFARLVRRLLDDGQVDAMSVYSGARIFEGFFRLSRNRARHRGTKASAAIV